jgi:hypothetical protein
MYAVVVRESLTAFSDRYLFLDWRAAILLGGAALASATIYLAQRKARWLLLSISLSSCVAAIATVVLWSAAYGAIGNLDVATAIDTPARLLDEMFWPDLRWDHLGHWFSRGQWFAWHLQNVFPVYFFIGLSVCALAAVVTPRGRAT